MDEIGESFGSQSLLEKLMFKFSNATYDFNWARKKSFEPIPTLFDPNLPTGYTNSFINAQSKVLRSYQGTEFHRFWMPDKKAKECYDCGRKFSSFWRKHHCRLCGQIFCATCCQQTISGKIIMCAGKWKKKKF